MRITPHAIAALALIAAAGALLLPPLLDLGATRSVPIQRLSVPSERVRPPLVTADRAIGPLVQAQAGLPMGNPFALRERGSTVGLPVPPPPPPPLLLPDPPPTPFIPAAR